MKYARGVARVTVPSRSGLVGNPSDLFGGAVIAFTLPELEAVVQAEPALGMELQSGEDVLQFEELASLQAAGARGEYPEGGPLSLLMAAAKRFADRSPDLGDRGVRLTVVRSSIPPGVGLAGSSAIVIGALRALGELFGSGIDRDELPVVAQACEVEELGITAGLQDRVVQTLGGLVFMDFDTAHPSGGRFEPLDPDLLPSLFVAWLADAASNSGTIHRAARERFDAGDREVVATMAEIAELAQRALTPLTVRDSAGFGMLMERNFELRRRAYELDPRHVELVETAQRLGAPANYAGSGGAIVGLFRDEDHLGELREALTALGCELLVRRAAER